MKHPYQKHIHLEGNGWTIEKYMSEDQTMTQSIEEASGYIPQVTQKRMIPGIAPH